MKIWYFPFFLSLGIKITLKRNVDTVILTLYSTEKHRLCGNQILAYSGTKCAYMSFPYLGIFICFSVIP